MVCLWNFSLKLVGLLKNLKSPVSEHLLTVNILKGSETVLKPAEQYFCHIFWCLWKEIGWKIFFSSISNLETVCYHIDTRWQVFSRSKSECLTQPIQMQLSPNRKLFAQCFQHFLNLYKILNTLKRASGTGKLLLKL